MDHQYVWIVAPPPPPPFFFVGGCGGGGGRGVAVFFVFFFRLCKISYKIGLLQERFLFSGYHIYVSVGSGVTGRSIEKDYYQ